MFCKHHLWEKSLKPSRGIPIFNRAVNLNLHTHNTTHHTYSLHIHTTHTSTSICTDHTLYAYTTQHIHIPHIDHTTYMHQCPHTYTQYTTHIHIPHTSHTYTTHHTHATHTYAQCIGGFERIPKDFAFSRISACHIHHPGLHTYLLPVQPRGSPCGSLAQSCCLMLLRGPGT